MGFLRRNPFWPPAPYILNPREPKDFPLGRWNLYIGGAGVKPDGYINLDIYPGHGVDLVANAEEMPFAADVFQRIECDAVLEHVVHLEKVLAEMTRVLAPGGYLHLVVPFCHPHHEYPKDYRRFTPEGLALLLDASLEIVAQGWRTGPTATLLVFVLEYVKSWHPSKLWRGVAHGLLGWLLFPLRYLDLLFFRSPRQHVLGNHFYIWARKAVRPPTSAA